MFQLSICFFVRVTCWALGIASNHINPPSLLSLFPQEKLFQWILRQQEEGSRVTTADIVAYLQVSLWFLALIVLLNLFAEWLFLLFSTFLRLKFYILCIELNALTNSMFCIILVNLIGVPDSKALNLNSLFGYLKGKDRKVNGWEDEEGRVG